MTEAEILKSTYLDKMTVFRPKKTKVDGETIFLKGKKGCKVYENEPCSLSIKSISQLSDKGAFYTSASEYKIFASPDIEIKANDTVVVMRGNTSYEMIAGESFLYPESHIEVKLKREERA